jgi:hypothetical protein
MLLIKSKSDDDVFIKWMIVYVNVASNQKVMMMHLSSWRIVVYVNVTSNRKVMMMIFIKLGNCLCKCYIKSKSDDDDIYQVGELFM